MENMVVRRQQQQQTKKEEKTKGTRICVYIPYFMLFDLCQLVGLARGMVASCQLPSPLHQQHKLVQVFVPVSASVCVVYMCDRALFQPSTHSQTNVSTEFYNI